MRYSNLRTDTLADPFSHVSRGISQNMPDGLDLMNESYVEAIWHSQNGFSSL